MAVCLRAWRRSREHNLGLMAAGLAFYAFVAFIPLVVALAFAYGLVADPATVVGHMQAITRTVSAEAAARLGELLTGLTREMQERRGWAAIVSLLTSLYVGVHGGRAVVAALDVVHGSRRRRGALRATALSFAIVLAALVVGAAGVVAISVLGYLEAAVTGLSGLAAALIKLGTWLGATLLVSAAIAALYRWAPAHAAPVPRRWLTPGSVAATAVWVVATLLLGIYAANFDRFDALYGSVAATMVVLVWFYLLAFAVLLGAELDAGLGEIAGGGPGPPRGGSE